MLGVGAMTERQEQDGISWDETAQERVRDWQKCVREQRQEKDSTWELRIMVILSGIFWSWAPQHSRNNWMNERQNIGTTGRVIEASKYRDTHLHSDKNFQSDFWSICVCALICRRKHTHITDFTNKLRQSTPITRTASGNERVAWQSSIARQCFLFLSFVRSFILSFLHSQRDCFAVGLLLKFMREPNISWANLSFWTDIFEIASLWQVWRRFWTHSNKFMCIYFFSSLSPPSPFVFIDDKPHNKTEHSQSCQRQREREKAQQHPNRNEGNE